MEINLSTPREVRGDMLRRATLSEETPDGRLQSIEAEVWVMADDSQSVLSERTRLATIALLERAIAALRTG